MRAARPVLRLACAAVLSAVVLAAFAALHPAEGGSYRRGINLEHVFIFPEAEGWPPFRGPKTIVTDDELERLVALGLDFIRLPVDPTPFVGATAEQRRDLLSDVAGFVRRADVAGLSVIVAGYTTDGDVAWRPDRGAAHGGQSFEAYAAWLEEIAVALEAAAPEASAIQLMNEPAEGCDDAGVARWNELQTRLHARIRAKVALPIVLTGSCWSGPEWLMRLDALPDDPNTLFDAHSYEPFAFTHQGATWTTPVLAHVGGLRFPPGDTDPAEAAEIVDRLVAERADGTAPAGELRARAMEEVARYRAGGAGPKEIAAEFAALATWAKARGIAPERVLIGEFGATGDADVAPPQSRELYLELIRRTAESHGFGWAMWGYYPSFGLLEDAASRKVSPSTVRALGLDAVTASGGARTETAGRKP